MAVSPEERNRILQLVESGQVTSEEAARLFDTLDTERARIRNRTVRVRVTDLTTNRQKIHVTIPVGLVNVGIRLGARLAPQFHGNELDELLHAIEQGANGRLLDLQDLEEGERVEIFVE